VVLVLNRALVAPGEKERKKKIDIEKSEFAICRDRREKQMRCYRSYVPIYS